MREVAQLVTENPGHPKIWYVQRIAGKQSTGYDAIDRAVTARLIRADLGDRNTVLLFPPQRNGDHIMTTDLTKAQLAQTIGEHLTREAGSARLVIRDPERGASGKFYATSGQPERQRTPDGTEVIVLDMGEQVDFS